METIPLLELDSSRLSLTNPSVLKDENIPVCCILTFYDDFLSIPNIKIYSTIDTPFGKIQTYLFDVNNKKLLIVKLGIGAPLASAMFENIIALGCSKFIVFGGCGVLDTSIKKNHLIILDKVVRDEGTSFHYIKSSYELSFDEEIINLIVNHLKDKKISHIVGKGWTTDGFYRETKQKILLRKKQGCITVDMEASALLAVAKYRNVKIGYILRSGDDISGSERELRNNKDSKSILYLYFQEIANCCIKM